MTAIYDHADHADDLYAPDGPDFATREALRGLMDSLESYANPPHDSTDWVDALFYAQRATEGLTVL